MEKVSALMFLSFVVVQILALAVGYAFLSSPPTSPFTNAQDVSNSYFLFGYVLVSALLLLLLLKYYHGVLLFFAVEALMLFFASQLVLILFIDAIPALLIALVLVGVRFKFPQTRPYFLAGAAAVVGALLGSWLGLFPAAVLAFLLLLYDIAAVFFTKHMIALAKGLSNRGASFSVTVSTKRQKVSPFMAADLKKPKRLAKAKKNGAAKSSSRTVIVPTLESIELGTGDLVIPAMLLVSALNFSFGAAIAELVGSSLGMVALLMLLERRRGYYPALPPLAGGGLIALIVFFVLQKAFGG